MRQAFVFERVAIVVGPWHEPMDPPERGARIEVRLLADEPSRGTPSAAQRIVVDQPLFRADLFDRMDQPTGNLGSAHFHPSFDGVEPCDRVWKDEIREDPLAWLTGELGDLPGLLERSGVETDGESWVAGDAAALRAALPDVTRAVEATWAAVRAD
jgi:hypothetical protein